MTDSNKSRLLSSDRGIPRRDGGATFLEPLRKDLFDFNMYSQSTQTKSNITSML